MMKMNLQFFAHKKGVGALVDGVVRFERKGRDKKQVSIYPVAE